MRYRILILAAVLILTAGCCNAEETPTASITAGEGWSWEAEGYNTFDGMIDLSAWIGQEITLLLSTDLTYGEEEEESKPVFTELNGKRIKMNKQTDSVTLTPDEETAVTAFSGRMNLPKKGSVSRVTFTISVRNAAGEELKAMSCTYAKAEEQSNAFWFSADLKPVTVCLAAAATTVWTGVLIRNRRRTTKKKTGEESDADL